MQLLSCIESHHRPTDRVIALWRTLHVDSLHATHLVPPPLVVSVMWKSPILLWNEIYISPSKKKKKMFVSQTRTHKYVDLLLPHSPMHIAQFSFSCWFFFFFFNFLVASKKFKEIGCKAAKKKKKNWAKNAIKKNSRISHCSFSEKKKT